MMNPLLFHWLVPFLLAIPTWETLESRLPSSHQPEPPIISLSHSSDKVDVDSILIEYGNKPIFYRDSNGICPYAQRVWLALEAKGVEYITILIPDTERQDGEECLKVRWTDGTTQTNSIDILSKIQTEYPDLLPNLYPSISLAVDSVNCNIARFKGVFPRNTRMDKRVPFLFKSQTEEFTSIDSHMVTLEETEEVLEEYDDGPFLCGDKVTAADIAWAPFLERYAVQLPMVFPGKEPLQPRSKVYGAVKEWYEAMEDCVPAWSCRVMGDVEEYANHLKKLLIEEEGMAEEEIGVVTMEVRNALSRKSFDGARLWAEYSKGKAYLANTPAEECAARIVRNREEIIADAKLKMPHISEEDVSMALREVCETILESGNADDVQLTVNAMDMLGFLVEEGMKAPRDIGMVPLQMLKSLAASVQMTKVV